MHALCVPPVAHVEVPAFTRLGHVFEFGRVEVCVQGGGRRSVGRRSGALRECTERVAQDAEVWALEMTT